MERMTVASSSAIWCPTQLRTKLYARCNMGWVGDNGGCTLPTQYKYTEGKWSLYAFCSGAPLHNVFNWKWNKGNFNDTCLRVFISVSPTAPTGIRDSAVLCKCSVLIEEHDGWARECNCNQQTSTSWPAFLSFRPRTGVNPELFLFFIPYALPDLSLQHKASGWPQRPGPKATTSASYGVHFGAQVEADDAQKQYPDERWYITTYCMWHDYNVLLGLLVKFSFPSLLVINPLM